MDNGNDCLLSQPQNRLIQLILAEIFRWIENFCFQVETLQVSITKSPRKNAQKYSKRSRYHEAPTKFVGKKGKHWIKIYVKSPQSCNQPKTRSRTQMIHSDDGAVRLLIPKAPPPMHTGRHNTSRKEILCLLFKSIKIWKLPQPPLLDVVVDVGFLFNDDSPIQVEVRMFIDFFNISHHHQDGWPLQHVDWETWGGILQFRIYIHRNFILFSVSINFKCSSSCFESILWNMVSTFHRSME